MDDFKIEAQQALDELLREGKLPFKLQACLVREEAKNFYVVYSYDSRLRSVSVTLEDGHSFRDLVRAAVLRKVSGLKSLAADD